MFSWFLSLFLSVLAHLSVCLSVFSLSDSASPYPLLSFSASLLMQTNIPKALATTTTTLKTTTTTTTTTTSKMREKTRKKFCIAPYSPCRFSLSSSFPMPLSVCPLVSVCLSDPPFVFELPINFLCDRIFCTLLIIDIFLGIIPF